MEAGSIAVFSRRAEAIYDENLNAYVKIVLRRPFARIIVRRATNIMAFMLTLLLGLLRRCRTTSQDHSPDRDFEQWSVQ